MMMSIPIDSGRDRIFCIEYRDKINAAVNVVKNNYAALSAEVGERISRDGYDAVKADLDILRDMKTLLDVIGMYSANRHHFEKYHAANEDAWGEGEFYLGVECMGCEYSRSQQRAVAEHSDQAEGK